MACPIFSQKLQDFNNFLNLEKHALNALVEFGAVEKSNELQFFKWLVKYEELHFDLILLHPDTVSEEAIKTGVIKLSDDSKFHFKTYILKNCIDLEEIFDTCYYEKLNKYDTTPEDHLEKQTPFDENYQQTSSLKYHLGKQNIL